VTDLIRTSSQRSRFFARRASVIRASIPSLLAWLIVIVPVLAAEKPAASPDQPATFATPSRVSAVVEFNASTWAAEIQRDIPPRLASIDERVTCVHRRVLFVKINANCDIRGDVARTSPVELHGKGDHVLGSVAIFGTVAGQGANRITSHIRGEAQARATVEAEARPELRGDWSLAPNFADGFHWDEAPYLHVLGRDIPLALGVEPIVVALRIAKTSASGSSTGEWVYLAATPQVEADRQTHKSPDRDVAAGDLGEMFGNAQLLARLRQQLEMSYRTAYQKLIDAANQNLTRQLKNCFRIEGRLASASLDRVLLLSDGISIALRATGELKIL